MQVRQLFACLVYPAFDAIFRPCFARCRYLCHEMMAGGSLADTLPPSLVPPSKRGGRPPVAEDPFGTAGSDA